MHKVLTLCIFFDIVKRGAIMDFITTDQRIAVENFTIGNIYTITFRNAIYFSGSCIGKGADFVSFQRTAPELLFMLTMQTAPTVLTITEGGGGTGTTDYNQLNNKPSINSVTLQGSLTLADLGIASSDSLEYAVHTLEAAIDIRATISDIYGRGTVIPAGTEQNPVSLDDYRMPGCFYCPNSATAATIGNVPEGGSGFKVIVEQTTQIAALIQTFYKAGRSDYFFKRSLYNDNWASWYKYTGTVVV